MGNEIRERIIRSSSDIAIDRAGFRDVGVVSRRNGDSCGQPGLGLLSITVTGTK